MLIKHPKRVVVRPARFAQRERDTSCTLGHLVVKRLGALFIALNNLQFFAYQFHMPAH